MTAMHHSPHLTIRVSDSNRKAPFVTRVKSFIKDTIVVVEKETSATYSVAV